MSSGNGRISGADGRLRPIVSLTSPSKPSDAPELILLLLLSIFYLGADALDDSINIVTANIFGNLSLVAILTFGAAQKLKQDPNFIWGPLFWFRAASALYYGIGMLVPYIGNYATINDLKRLFYFSDADVLKVNIINILCITSVLLASKITKMFLSTRQQNNNSIINSRSIKIFMICFLLIGGAARYFIVVPFLFGFGEGVLSSIVSSVAKAYSAGLMLLVIIALRENRTLLIGAFVLIVLDVFVGILLFSKTDVITTILFIVLAFYYSRPSVMRFSIGVLIGIWAFNLLAPVIGYGRDRTIKLGGGRQIANLEQRVNIVSDYYNQEFNINEDANQAQHALERICYVGAEALVVAFYDRGNEGSTLKYFFAAIVPRFLWPDKPDITADGRDLYTAATGQVGTSITSGLFAESYWNFGWFGIPLMMFPMGCILALLTYVSSSIMRGEQWLYLPVVLIGIQVGTRVDGHYVTDVIGGSLTVAIMFTILRVVDSIVLLRGAQR